MELKDTLRNQLKDALYLLGIDCKSRGNAFITPLWGIALTATRRTNNILSRLFKRKIMEGRLALIIEQLK
jgi:hypothetical protein